jgi:hypothetical protein
MFWLPFVVVRPRNRFGWETASRARSCPFCPRRSVEVVNADRSDSGICFRDWHRLTYRAILGSA